MNKEELKNRILRLHAIAKDLEKKLLVSADPDLEGIYEDTIETINKLADQYNGE